MLFHWGFSSIRLSFLDSPRSSGIFLDFRALRRHSPTLGEKSQAQKKNMIGATKKRSQ